MVIKKFKNFSKKISVFGTITVSAYFLKKINKNTSKKYTTSIG